MLGRLASTMGAIAAIANRPRRDRGATRAIYSYPAKFQAQLPAELIRLFTKPGDLVVDPYSGGGTTGLEAQLAGRAFVGADINPFACLVARVKTTPVTTADVDAALARTVAARARRPILDDGDAECLGPTIADELARLAAGLDALPAGAARDLLMVALLHAIKIAGRRDFDGDSIVPGFRRRVAHIVDGLAALPAGSPRPRFRAGPAHELADVEDAAARLVVTSPPYKDLDVEYGLIQLQRRHLRRSKRSRVIWSLLGVEPVAKSALCGGRGTAYWTQLEPALREIRRVLQPGAPAFFWIGFKSDADRDGFVARLAANGLPAAELIPVGLSHDRVASSRSTHHGRATGMLASDYLIVAT
jgi:site-specific DNA-methyltransferase (cytosine-N4-specific)